ncbi:MAG: hypothetical protein CL573_04075 [Alphaproteobacteria bacterium]|nr:hypothetical protein [Alphaproteobacteria bacterium]
MLGRVLLNLEQLRVFANTYVGMAHEVFHDDFALSDRHLVDRPMVARNAAAEDVVPAARYADRNRDGGRREFFKTFFRSGVPAA